LVHKRAVGQVLPEVLGTPHVRRREQGLCVALRVEHLEPDLVPFDRGPSRLAGRRPAELRGRRFHATSMRNRHPRSSAKFPKAGGETHFSSAEQTPTPRSSGFGCLQSRYEENEMKNQV